MPPPIQHFDAAETSAAFARELELIKPTLYTVVYPAVTFETVMPVSSDKSPAAEFITYRMADQVGIAKIISNYADDLPAADVSLREFTLKVYTLGISAGWNLWELAASIMAGRPLDKARLSSAKEQIIRLANKLAFIGDTTIGLYGFTNHPNIPNTVVTTYDAVTTWAAKLLKGTAGRNAILDDLNLPFTRVATATKGAEVFDTVAMGPTNYQQIAQATRSDTSDTTILEMFLKAHPGVTVIVVPELETSGTGGLKQVICYRRSPDKAELEIPQDLVIHEPERRGLRWLVAVTMRFAGLQMRYPLAFDSTYGT